MAEVIQQVYRQHLTEGWPGYTARPNVASKFMMMKVSVPAGARNPRPGDALVYDKTTNTVHTPATDATVKDTIGVCSYDIGTVTQTLSTTPTGANSNAYVEYKADDFALVCMFGVIYARAGAACSYNDPMVFDRTNNNWVIETEPAIAPAGTAGTLTAIPADAVGTSIADLRTEVNALLAALRTQTTELQTFAADVAAYDDELPKVKITCDNETAVASGGLVMLNIGVRG